MVRGRITHGSEIANTTGNAGNTSARRTAKNAREKYLGLVSHEATSQFQPFRIRPLGGTGLPPSTIAHRAQHIRRELKLGKGSSRGRLAIKHLKKRVETHRVPSLTQSELEATLAPIAGNRDDQTADDSAVEGSFKASLFYDTDSRHGRRHSVRSLLGILPPSIDTLFLKGSLRSVGLHQAMNAPLAPFVGKSDVSTLPSCRRLSGRVVDLKFYCTFTQKTNQYYFSPSNPLIYINKKQAGI